MKKIKYALALLATAALSFTEAAAQKYHCLPENFIISTGVDNNGNILPVGTPDPHWTNLQGMGNVTTPNGAWGNFAGSTWLGNSNGGAVTNYTYTLSFTNNATASLSFSAMADNYVVIQLDGNPIAQTPGLTPYGFFVSNAATYSGLVPPGSHTLTAIATNQGGPAGFNLNGSLTSNPVPVTMDLSTGMNNGSPVPVGNTDPNWTGTYNTVINAHPAWATLSGSQWLGDNSGVPPGFYVYTRNFTIPTGGTLNLQALADNNVQVALDGNPITQTPGLTIYGFQMANVCSYSAGITPGAHTLTAKVYNEGGPMGLDVRATVTYCGDPTPPPCNADPTFTATYGGGTTVNFASNHVALPGTNVYHTWDFGDGSIPSNAANPSHTYAPGTYNVVHTVVVQVLAADGTVIDECVQEKVCTLVVSDKDTRDRAIQLYCDGLPPVQCHVDPTFSATWGGGLTANFTSNNVVYASTVVTHYWNFGDGGTSTAANPSHTYTSPGSYVVMHDVLVQVLDASGHIIKECRDVKECNLVIDNRPTGVRRPILQLYCSATPVQPCLGDATYTAAYRGGLDAEFTSNNIPYANTVVDHEWNFGDRTGSTDVNPIHSYAAGGDYMVTHTVTTEVYDDQGAVIDLCKYTKVCKLSIYNRTIDPLLMSCINAKPGSGTSAVISEEPTLAPNPAQNELTIRSNGEVYDLQIISVDGRIAVQTQSYTGKQNTIDISKLAHGTYIAVIRQGTETKHIRFVKVQ